MLAKFIYLHIDYKDKFNVSVGKLPFRLAVNLNGTYILVLLC